MTKRAGGSRSQPCSVDLITLLEITLPLLYAPKRSPFRVVRFILRGIREQEL
jgi:hypothetical protein